MSRSAATDGWVVGTLVTLGVLLGVLISTSQLPLLLMD